jgi:hypothetical protein
MDIVTDNSAVLATLEARIARLEAENDRYRNGYKGGCWTCESVGELNVKLEAAIRKHRDTVWGSDETFLAEPMNVDAVLYTALEGQSNE